MTKYLVLEIEVGEEEVYSLKARQVCSSLKAADQYISNHLEASKRYIEACRNAADSNEKLLIKLGLPAEYARAAAVRYRLWGAKSLLEDAFSRGFNLSEKDLKSLVQDPERPKVNGFNLHFCEIPTKKNK